jgi:hypothetical protein
MKKDYSFGEPEDDPSEAPNFTEGINERNALTEAWNTLYNPAQRSTSKDDYGSRSTPESLTGKPRAAIKTDEKDPAKGEPSSSRTPPLTGRFGASNQLSTFGSFKPFVRDQKENLHPANTNKAPPAKSSIFAADGSLLPAFQPGNTQDFKPAPTKPKSGSSIFASEGLLRPAPQPSHKQAVKTSSTDSKTIGSVDQKRPKVPNFLWDTPRVASPPSPTFDSHLPSLPFGRPLASTTKDAIEGVLESSESNDKELKLQNWISHMLPPYRTGNKAANDHIPHLQMEPDSGRSNEGAHSATPFVEPRKSSAIGDTGQLKPVPTSSMTSKVAKEIARSGVHNEANTDKTSNHLRRGFSRKKEAIANLNTQIHTGAASAKQDVANDAAHKPQKHDHPREGATTGGVVYPQVQISERRATPAKQEDPKSQVPSERPERSAEAGKFILYRVRASVKNWETAKDFDDDLIVGDLYLGLGRTSGFLKTGIRKINGPESSVSIPRLDRIINPWGLTESLSDCYSTGHSAMPLSVYRLRRALTKTQGGGIEFAKDDYVLALRLQRSSDPEENTYLVNDLKGHSGTIRSQDLYIADERNRPWNIQLNYGAWTAIQKQLIERGGFTEASEPAPSNEGQAKPIKDSSDESEDDEDDEDGSGDYLPSRKRQRVYATGG